MPLLAPVTMPVQWADGGPTGGAVQWVRHSRILHDGEIEDVGRGMRITLVGPAYPWPGGLPLLVTDLAHRLTAEGHGMQTWTRQGPARLLPTRPLTAPEGTVFPAEP